MRLITQTQYTILVTVVILSAVVPTLIAQGFFRPIMLDDEQATDIEAQGELDAGLVQPRVPLRRP